MKRNSILFKISALITVLCVLIMTYSAHELYHGWISYQQATELSIVQDVTQNFSDGLKNFMFERGRTNVVLSKEQPISIENSAFLSERRAAADIAFEAGFLAIAKDYPEATEKLQMEYENIKALRSIIDTEAVKPLSQRDVAARKLWFNSCTDYINTVITEINVIRQLSQNNSNISNYFDVVIGSLNFRSIVGNESSIITSAIAGNGIISDEDNDILIFLMGEETQVWSEIENTIEMLDSQNLKAALENVREQYYLRFRPEQKRIIELSQNGQLYEGADKEMADLSVPALDSILNLSNEAVKEIERENELSIKKGLNSFLAGLGQLFACILIVIFVPIYFRNKFVQPLNEIIVTLEDIIEGKVYTQIPHIKRADEIGKLAQGAFMLKNSVIEEQTLKQELEQAVLQLEELSVRDSLTSLYNRRYVNDQLEELTKRYKRNGKVFSVIICDIDNFKSFNDRYGHECGDKVLMHISKQLSTYCGESDVLARWGGEEFLFLLPDTGREGAEAIAERVRAGLENKIYECDFFSLNVTMTFGVAEYSEKEGVFGTVRKADMALLQGKNNGRNQVVVF